MGDGRVALILDVLGIAQSSGVVSEVRARALAEREAGITKAERGEKQALLLFNGPDEARMAVPLDRVGRLEEFPLPSVERAGAARIVQYRGELLPLMFLSELLEERRKSPRRKRVPETTTGSERLQGIVYNGEGRRIGLVIDRILDIVEETVEVKSSASRRGVLCTAVVQGRVTEMLDVPALLAAFERQKPEGGQRRELAEV